MSGDEDAYAGKLRSEAKRLRESGNGDAADWLEESADAKSAKRLAEEARAARERGKLAEEIARAQVKLAAERAKPAPTRRRKHTLGGAIEQAISALWDGGDAMPDAAARDAAINQEIAPDWPLPVTEAQIDARSVAIRRTIQKFKSRK